MRKILVTGAAGYIGSVLIRQLLMKGYKVRGLDTLFFGGDSLLGIYNHPNFEFIKGDIRNHDVIENAVLEVTDIVHLAAIIGDLACSKQPKLAYEINWEATKNLFDYCEQKTEVKNFIFASTCSNYGKMEGDGFVNENSELKPVSLYAELKVKFEEYLLKSKTRNNFYPTSLRFSTVYGLSPRIRFDLTVNEFMKEVALGRELKIFGEQFWRPYCHVNDIASACVTVLESVSELIDHNVFNVGDTNENYTKKMIANEILEIVADAKISFIKKNEDPRDYKVDFSKIKDNLRFNTTKTVKDGLLEINQIIKYGIIDNPDNEKYKNI